MSLRALLPLLAVLAALAGTLVLWSPPKAVDRNAPALTRPRSQSAATEATGPRQLRAETAPAPLPRPPPAPVEASERDPADAAQDPNLRDIERYEKYTPAQLRLETREMRARKLVLLMVDPKMNFNVRTRAQKAIIDGARFRGDPDLSLSEKHGAMSTRAWFCNTHVIANLEHEDVKSRKLTNQLLKTLWHINTVTEILTYDVSDERTWEPARRAWQGFMQKN